MQVGSGTTRPGLGTVAALALASATLLFALRPLPVGLPSGGLDGSWIAVLGEAATRPARWGVDLAFTYGPASALVTRYYTDAYLATALPVLGGVALVQGFCTVQLARAAVAGGRLGALLLLGAVAVEAAGLAAELAQDQDAFCFAFVFTLFLLDLVRRPGDRASLALLAAGAALMGPMALAKTSFGVAALLLFVLADARAMRGRERGPLATPLFLVGALGAFVACGQRLGDLPAYLDLQGQVAAGYGEAMYLVPARAEVAAFLIGVAVLVVAVGVWTPAGADRIGRLSAMLAVVAVAAIAFKAGFVRADTHPQIAWGLLGLAGLAVAAALALPRSLAGAAALAGASLAVLWVAAPLSLLAGTGRLPELGNLAAVYRDIGALLDRDVEAWMRFLRSPSGFAAKARAAKASAWASIRAADPLPDLAGRVDILAYEQSAVLAAGLDYHPRPSFQEYSTYTARLIAANQAFYAGPDAPDWVLFGIGGLDDRYPAMTEGALWPELLRRYEPVLRAGDRVALHRRAVPLPEVLGARLRVDARLGEHVAVPQDGPVFARITVEKTWLGRLAAAVFRPPALSLRVTRANGQEPSYRFIPALGAAGFLLSPTIESAGDVADLGLGAGDVAEGFDVTRLVVGGSRWADLFYRAAIGIEFQPLVVVAPPPGPAVRARFPELDDALPWRHLARALGRAKDLGGARLSALAPTALTIPAAGARRLRVGFGIEDGAWTQGRTQGVCFSVAASAKDPAPFWRRCLDPGAVPADRGPQSAEVDLPPGLAAVTAETTCRASCDWGWSYWSGIAPER